MTHARLLAAALLCGVAGLAGAAAVPPVTWRTDDVERFFQVYDAAHGHPDAAQLQAGYLDPGSVALRQFVVARIGDATELATAVARRPAAFADARSCLPALTETRAQLPAVFARLAQRHPAAAFPPVTFVIGRDSTGGTTTPEGITIGLEKMCGSRWMGEQVGPRFTHIVAHELAHVQQPAAQVDAPPHATLLFQSLVEGGAELVAELVSGEISNVQLKAWTRGHECAIEQAFQRDLAGTDISHWLYNGPGTPEAPGDLGYWVGYRISKAYYEHASDKRRALSELLLVDNGNAPALLARSGWTPQTGCGG